MHGLLSDAGVWAGDLANKLMCDVMEALLLQGLDLATPFLVLGCRNRRGAENLFESRNNWC